MTLEHWRNESDRREQKYVEKNLSQWHYYYYYYYWTALQSYADLRLNFFKICLKSAIRVQSIQ